jgi:hypothetical protein
MSSTTLYFADGALEVWVIDAKRKAMTVYSKQNDQVIRRVVDREYRSLDPPRSQLFHWLRSSSEQRIKLRAWSADCRARSLSNASPAGVA